MGRFMVGPQEGSLVYICTKLEADCLIHSKVIRGPKIWKLGHVTRATPTFRSFYNPYAGRVRSIYRFCSRFEADSSIRSKVIKGSQNVEIRSRDAGHAHLWVDLWYAHRTGTSDLYMSVPNLNQIAQFVPNL